ncbi:potassium-transporting ATPase subunit KdpA [Microlunatus elymi]|uniref:Potassium-transporting ATPase potassium-binding subunit n=1 Tax=Microlunatus elymi TaxID=2596828 RepID=A0A516Q1T0_9ACTN|nr:potassium-transporting ATPase subunit KdpA [Microlunatus elymi]QDP97390.1 potassium-transporting ATPase subunit KdpA [Microlunatus elymi]
MSDLMPGLLQLAMLLVLVGGSYLLLGSYMARAYSSPRHLAVEKLIYRTLRIDPDGDQRWGVYYASVLGFSAAGVLFLYGLLRLQGLLPLSNNTPGFDPALAWNTAVSFVTNTNWQAYPGENLGYLAQMAGLAVQNFASAAVGMCVAVALIRGLARSRTDRLGNFWTDLVRSVIRILLPISIVVAVMLILTGVVQNFAGPETVHTLAGGSQTLPGGPVASQEVIKQLGTNGGGFYNANSAHPFENPNPVSNLIEIALMLIIPVGLARTYGLLVGRPANGHAVLAFMGVLWLAGLVIMWIAESAHGGIAAGAAGAAMEGKEVRFGIAGSVLYNNTSTGTSSGPVNAMGGSFTALGGGMMMLNMMLGEVSPGGTGSGLYGALLMAIMAVFLAGLMIGRTPEFLGKRIGRREISYVALYTLAMPAILLVGAAVASINPAALASRNNSGSSGLSEILYAFASASNNNGSAFAGLSANTYFYNTMLGFCMLIGRFILIGLVLALAGSLAGQVRRPVSGSLPTHTPLFVGLHVFTALIVAGLTFFPALALGPIASAVS